MNPMKIKMANPPDVIKTGTTTTGIIIKDAVILGADKRATMGYYVASKTAEKINMIKDHVAMTIAGSVADAQYLISMLRELTNLYELEHEKKVPVKTVAKMLSNILYQSKYPVPYQVHHLVAGFDTKGPKLYDIGGYGSILDEKFSSTGSGSVFAYGVLEDGYSEELSVKEGTELLKKAVKAAISRDVASGNGIDIIIISKDKHERKFFKPV